VSKKILLVVTSHDRINNEKVTGLWLEEFAIPYELFKQKGYTVTVASPQGGRAPIDPRSLPTDNEVAKFEEAQRILENTLPVNTVDVTDYDAIFLPGGHGTMFDLPVPQIGQLIGQFADSGKVVAAVCHGPAGLVAATRADGQPVVKGHRLTGFTNDEERAAELDKDMPFLLESKLRELGATFVASPMWSDHVEIDGFLVTGQNPQSSAGTARAVIQLLEDVVETA
jgi:putative intracellular protease/amidase